MTDHRRTPSQRAYQLPGWFFVITILLGLAGFGTAGWLLLGDRVTFSPASTPATTVAPEPEPTLAPTDEPDADADADVEADRTSTEVVVLNASTTTGLARRVATTAEEAGWTVQTVGNWAYPAVVNAVYFPPGHEEEADLLADDLGIESVRAIRTGMSDDALTVLLVQEP